MWGRVFLLQAEPHSMVWGRENAAMVVAVGAAGTAGTSLAV